MSIQRSFCENEQYSCLCPEIEKADGFLPSAKPFYLALAHVCHLGWASTKPRIGDCDEGLGTWKELDENPCS